MAFRFRSLEIPEMILIESDRPEDDRGFFREVYQRSVFAQNNLPKDFVQDNYSHSVRGVLRGLHYQKVPAAQGKLVIVIRGEIFDVGVDIRKGSPTYGKWAGEVLSAANCRLLYIPAGFAHGFCVLSDAADVSYKVTREYAPALDRGIIYSDPEIGIRWPIPNPILSEKDLNLPLLRKADNNFVYPPIDPAGG